MADDEGGTVKEPLIPEPAPAAPAKKEDSARTATLKKAIKDLSLHHPIVLSSLHWCRHLYSLICALVNAQAFKAKKTKLTWKQWFIKNWVYVLCAAIFGTRQTIVDLRRLL